MATEIERKFLVTGTEYRNLGKGTYYQQGYLSSDPERTIRIRVVGDRGMLTIKGKTEGISRAEYEYQIPLAEAKDMLHALCLRPLIEKTRYRVPFAGKVWEVDEFLGENEGLVVAEIELPSADCPFEKPSWIGQEVSHDPRYYNSNLSKHPFKDW
ncbi:MAG: CYTH domain-containing protein [Paludibacteraceae bacterium]|nr:CYTH domain-containing protein [Paludibacteraceae bacterium]